jgi:hypothetical protein
MTKLNNIYAQIINPELFDSELFEAFVKTQDKTVLKDLFISRGFLNKLNLTKSNENLEFILNNFFNDLPGAYGINSFYLVEKLTQTSKIPTHLKSIQAILKDYWQEDLSKMDLISYRKEDAVLRFNQKELNHLNDRKLSAELNRKIFHLYLMTKEDAVFGKVNKSTLLNNWNQDDDTLFKQIFSQKSVHAMNNDKVFTQLLKEKTLEQLSNPEVLFKLINHNVEQKQILQNYTMFFNTVGFNFKKDCKDLKAFTHLVLDNSTDYVLDTLSLSLELGLKINKDDLTKEKVEKTLQILIKTKQLNQGINLYQHIANKKTVLHSLSQYDNWDETSFKKLIKTFCHLVDEEKQNSTKDYLGNKTAIVLLLEFIAQNEKLFKAYPNVITEDFKTKQDLVSLLFKSGKADTLVKLVECGADTNKLYSSQKTQMNLMDLAKSKKSKVYQPLVIAIEKIQLDNLITEPVETKNKKLKI